MLARDVMVAPVITVKQSMTVRVIAKLFVDRGISGAPVVDDNGHMIGIVSENDFLHRAEVGTERRRSRWLLAYDAALAADYIKSHAQHVTDVMTRSVVSAEPETPLRDVAMLMEKHSIKRIPIVTNGELVGIVTRSNLVQALASTRKALGAAISDTDLRERVLTHLNAQPWAHTSSLNIIVTDGVVDLWGITSSRTEREAIRVAAESMPGVRAVNNHLFAHPIQGGF